MSGVRIQFMLYPDFPDDAIVLEWLESLPKSATGRLRVKRHVVPILVGELRGKKKHSVKRRIPKKADQSLEEEESVPLKPKDSGVAKESDKHAGQTAANPLSLSYTVIIFAGTQFTEKRPHKIEP